jgi:hypothetical protein
MKSRSGRIDKKARIFRFFPLKPRANAMRRPTPRWESEFTIVISLKNGKDIKIYIKVMVRASLLLTGSGSTQLKLSLF